MPFNYFGYFNITRVVICQPFTGLQLSINVSQKKIMRYYFALLILILSGSAFGQSICPDLVLTNTIHDTIHNHRDTLHCSETCVTLHVVPTTDLRATTTYSVTAIPYNFFPFTAGTNCMASGGTSLLTAFDDEFGDLVTIPFNFCFFGNTYSRLVPGTNGNVTFNAALANTGDPWSISGPLPASAGAGTNNCIMSPWNDIQANVGLGGRIRYATYGTAPCRQFVVSWDSAQLFSSGSCPNQYSTEQAVLYESSNIIEINIHHRLACTAWNNGFAITGIGNAPGTVFYTAPGENATTFTATDESWRFTPTGPPGPWVFTWYDSTKAITLGSADSLVVCPTVTTMYYVKATSSACAGVVLWDSVLVVRSNIGLGIDSTSFRSPTSCVTNNDGWILFHGYPPGDSVFVTYRDGGVPRGPVVMFPDIDSNIIFAGLPAGTYDQFFFKHDSCISGPFGPFVLTLPIISINRESVTNPTICGKCDGSIVLHGLPPSSPFILDYTKGGTPQPRKFGTVLPDSTIHLDNLCDGTYAGFATSIGACNTTGTSVTIVNPPPIPASFDLVVKLGCEGDLVKFINTSTPSGFTSGWTFGDGGTSAVTNPQHVYADTPGFTGTYTIRLTYSSYGNPACVSTHDTTIIFNHPIDASITSDKDTICLGDSIMFAAHTISADGPTYLWDFGNGVTSTLMNPTYTYPVAGNYIPQLTVTDTIGCSRTATENVQVVSIKVRTGVHDTAVCLRDSMTLRSYVIVKPDSSIPYNYVWTQTPEGPNFLGNPNIQNPKFFSVGTYIYTVTVTTDYITSPDILHCVATDTERIVSYPPVTLINLTVDQTIPFGSSIQLNADGAVRYTWTPPNGTLDNPNINNPVATPVDSVTIYTVYGMNLFGCLDSADIIIHLDMNVTEALPTAFTPNGDGLNDIFRLTKLKYQKLVEFSVFNRWGQKVFSTNNNEKGWDGTYQGVPQDMDVYHYLVIVAHPDGSNVVYKGDVTLIR